MLKKYQETDLFRLHNIQGFTVHESFAASSDKQRCKDRLKVSFNLFACYNGNGYAHILKNR